MGNHSEVYHKKLSTFIMEDNPEVMLIGSAMF